MIPKHIGFIMDGNGRWAQSHDLPRSEGYPAGVLALRKVAFECAKKGVQTVTFYAFSTENFNRPKEEINSIFKVIEKFNLSYDGECKITYMGDIYSLPESLYNSICIIEEKTEKNPGININIAINYGARADILHAVQVCIDHCENVEEIFESALSSSRLPKLDLIVRTGGEKRLSNFMLYEAAYSELIFLDKFWPDMEEEDVDAIIDEFEQRNRKFGR